MTDITTNPTGTRFWFDSQVMEVILSARDTGDQLSIMRQELGAEYAPPVHVHDREDQTLVVLEGSITAWLDPLGDAPTQVLLQPGDAVYLPRGIPHAFKVGDDGATMLEVNTPGGFEHFHLDAGDEATHDGIPDQSPTDIERMAHCATEYGCQILGPPIGQ